MTRRLLLITIAVLALIASGCGGGSNETASVAEFEASVVTTRDRVDFALSRITKAESKEDFLNRMEQAGTTIKDAADDLSGVEPPEDYAPETTRLVDSLRQLSIDLQATAEQIRQPGFENLVQNAAGLNFESWDQANLALAGLLGKGIDVKLIERH